MGPERDLPLYDGLGVRLVGEAECELISCTGLVDDRTETPGEINLDTGILSDRRQAQRWEVSPNFAHRVRPHTSVTGSYDFVAESLVDNGSGRMQVVRAGLSQIVSERSTVSGVVQERHFADPTDASNASDSVAVLGGWDHQFSPSSRFSLQAGPRVSSYRGLEPEVSAGVTRATLRLRDAALATAANTVSLVRYGALVAGHVMDPATGWPARALTQASVVTRAAVAADALSTAMLVSGRAPPGVLKAYAV